MATARRQKFIKPKSMGERPMQLPEGLTNEEIGREIDSHLKAQKIIEDFKKELDKKETEDEADAALRELNNAEEVAHLAKLDTQDGIERIRQNIADQAETSSALRDLNSSEEVAHLAKLDLQDEAAGKVTYGGETELTEADIEPADETDLEMYKLRQEGLKLQRPPQKKARGASEQRAADQLAMERMEAGRQNRAEKGSTVGRAELQRQARKVASGTESMQAADFISNSAMNNDLAGRNERAELKSLDNLANSRNEAAKYISVFGIKDADAYAERLAVSSWAQIKHAAKMLNPNFRRAWNAFVSADSEYQAAVKMENFPDVMSAKVRTKGSSDINDKIRRIGNQNRF